MLLFCGEDSAVTIVLPLIIRECKRCFSFPTPSPLGLSSSSSGIPEPNPPSWEASGPMLLVTICLSAMGRWILCPTLFQVLRQHLWPLPRFPTCTSFWLLIPQVAGSHQSESSDKSVTSGPSIRWLFTLGLRPASSAWQPKSTEATWGYTKQLEVTRHGQPKQTGLNKRGCLGRQPEGWHGNHQGHAGCWSHTRKCRNLSRLNTEELTALLVRSSKHPFCSHIVCNLVI